MARKELRSLAPFVALVVLVWGAGDLAEVLLSDHPDRKPLASGLDDLLDDGGAIGVIGFLMAFALALGLLVGERDRGRLELLDSLPVSRTRVFTVKVVIALLILWSGPLIGVLTASVLHGLSRTSLDQGFHPNILGALVFSYGFHIAVCFCWGLLLSFLRRFAWIMAALIYLTVDTLATVNPAFSVLNAGSLVPPTFEGQRWVVPARLLAVQGGLAALALALAWRLFLGGGDRLLRGLSGLRESRPGRILLGGASLIAVGLWIAVIGRSAPMEEADESAEPRSISRVSTHNYVITFPAGLEDAATALARKADDVHEQVRAFLDAPSAGTIPVDATGIRASAGASGLASWKSIRLDLTDADDADGMAAVLGHETVHVHAAALSDRRLDLPFLNEGMAEYVENRLFRPPSQSALRLLQAAVLRAHRQVHFEELMDPDLLKRRQDSDVVYPLGEVFIAALVESYGERAPARLLRALGRDDAPKLEGLELYQDAFREAGYDIDVVVDRFYARLDEGVSRHTSLIERLPRLRGVVSRKGDKVGIRVQPDRGPLTPDSTFCRFRPAEDSAREEAFYGDLEEGSWWTDRNDFPSGVVHYQLGLSVREAGLIWEPWAQAPIPHR